jgi:hypothetical protein
MNFLTQLALKIDAGANGIPEASGDTLLSNGLEAVYFLAGALAVIVIIVSGIFYIISNGDAGRVAKAKNYLTYAVVGLVVVLMAWGITNFVIGRF